MIIGGLCAIVWIVGVLVLSKWCEDDADEKSQKK